MFERELPITRRERFHVPDLVRNDIERRIMRSYVQIIFQAQDGNRIRTVPVGQFGAFEVRLTELPRDERLSNLPPLWLEVFSSDDQSSIDSLGVFEFNAAEMTLAVELIAASL
jgi:hypothetical protein